MSVKGEVGGRQKAESRVCGPLSVVSCNAMWFELLSRITHIETIAVGTSIRELSRLRKRYGAGRWRKRKGVGTVRLADGTICWGTALV